jgi:7,8-dihydro-6-hydroxymethylpterin-pyrophosphokinase
MDGVSMRETELTIPHAEAHRRDFVRIPMQDLEPTYGDDLRHVPD